MANEAEKLNGLQEVLWTIAVPAWAIFAAVLGDRLFASRELRKILLWLLIPLVFASWILIAKVTNSYESVSALFSGLGFVGILLTIWSQDRSAKNQSAVTSAAARLAALPGLIAEKKAQLSKTGCDQLLGADILHRINIYGYSCIPQEVERVEQQIRIFEVKKFQADVAFRKVQQLLPWADMSKSAEARHLRDMSNCLYSLADAQTVLIHLERLAKDQEQAYETLEKCSTT